MGEDVFRTRKILAAKLTRLKHVNVSVFTMAKSGGMPALLTMRLLRRGRVLN